MAAVQRFTDGGAVGIPFLQTLDVDPAEFPLFQRVAFARQKPAQLFGASDVEPEFEK